MLVGVIVAGVIVTGVIVTGVLVTGVLVLCSRIGGGSGVLRSGGGFDCLWGAQSSAQVCLP